MKFWWWRFRVCWVGLCWHGIWVWSHCEESDWREWFEDEMTPEDQYIEGWCRE